MVPSLPYGLIVILLGVTLFIITCNAIREEDLAWIEKDLAPFSGGITKAMIEEAKKMPRTFSIRIHNHKAQYFGNYHPGYHTIFDSIADKLPNMEFVINYEDGPRIYKNQCNSIEEWPECACDKDYHIDYSHGFFLQKRIGTNRLLPLFAYGGTISRCYKDILLPTFDLWVESLAEPPIPWDQKVLRAIWRGSTTGGGFGEPPELHFSRFHRQKLVTMCRGIPLCDAKFSQYIQCTPSICQQMRNEYGPESYIPMAQQFRNKIIIDIDGNSFSTRFVHLLRSGSVVFKAFSFEDHILRRAKPWVHYVPIKMDLSDLEEKILWAANNDREIREIGQRGREFALSNLRQQDTREYVIHLLKRYHSLLVDYDD